MSKEQKETVVLKDEELQQVSGGFDYNEDPCYWFDTNDIVEDSAGVRYQILALNEIEVSNGVKHVWFDALVLYVPVSSMGFTYCRENDIHKVNSSFVWLVK